MWDAVTKALGVILPKPITEFLRRPGRIVFAVALTVATALQAQNLVDPVQPVLQFRVGFLELARKTWPPPQPEIAALIERSFDLAQITRAVLGKHVDAASPAQQARLSRALALR